MKDKPFNNPFAKVGKAMKKDLASRKDEEAHAAERAAKAQRDAAEAARTANSAQVADEDLFLSAMRGAAPIHGDTRGVSRPPLPPGDASAVPIHDEDAEVLAELSSLVDGSAEFDIADSDEFIEGGLEGLDRRIFRKLRNGDFSVRAHLDLHGFRKDEAKQEVELFLTKARADGQRCVLIVHGRGLNSKDQIPVLKTALKSWLERGRIARSILAFSTARPHDGGAGAVYVLLRR